MKQWQHTKQDSTSYFSVKKSNQPSWSRTTRTLAAPEFGQNSLSLLPQLPQLFLSSTPPTTSVSKNKKTTASPCFDFQYLENQSSGAVVFLCASLFLRRFWRRIEVPMNAFYFSVKTNWYQTVSSRRPSERKPMKAIGVSLTSQKMISRNLLIRGVSLPGTDEDGFEWLITTPRIRSLAGIAPA